MKLRLQPDDKDYLDLCALTVLGNYSNFREETGAMETLVLGYGHICIFCQKSILKLQVLVLGMIRVQVRRDFERKTIMC